MKMDDDLGVPLFSETTIYYAMINKWVIFRWGMVIEQDIMYHCFSRIVLFYLFGLRVQYAQSVFTMLMDALNFNILLSGLVACKYIVSSWVIIG